MPAPEGAGEPPPVIALFGPTAVGKTEVAIALAERLRESGEDPVAVNCDSIQVYRGLEILSGAAAEEQRARLEHRLLSFVPVTEEYTAGRYAEAAHAEIDGLLAAGRRPIVVGGTGLYLRAALAELDLRPPVDPALRAEVEAELEERGPGAMHGELPDRHAEGIDPADRKRIARATELLRAGHEPPAGAEAMWSASPRRPTVLVGLAEDRDVLAARISDRVDAMVAAGAADEVAAADAAGASRTARAALGFEELLTGGIEQMKTRHRRYARRQLTWMRRMENVRVIDRGGRAPEAVAREVAE